MAKIRPVVEQGQNPSLLEQNRRPPTRSPEPRTLRHYHAVALTNKNGKKKMTAEEQEADFQRRLHEERRLGEYSDSAVANAWRVKHHTVKVKFDNDVQPDVERAPVDQLGTERYIERYMEQSEANVFWRCQSICMRPIQGHVRY
jgi:hypothetical protein